MQKWLLFFVPLMLILFMMCSDSSNNSKETASLSGVVVNQDGDPVNGAAVLVGARQAATDITGAFLVSAEIGNQNVIITANGYESVTGSVTLTAGGSVLDTVVMASYNATRLGEISSPSNYAAYKNLVEYSGFQVNNNPATNQGYADAHLNMLMSLDNLNKSLTLGDIVSDLGVSGVLDGNGYSLGSTEVVGTMQALFEVALTRPNDPRSLPLLYLMLDANGNLPTSVPVVSEYTTFTASQSMVLLSAVRFLAEHHPTDVSLSKNAAVSKLAKPAQLYNEVLATWYSLPVSVGSFDAAGAQLAGSNTFSFVGLYAGFAVSTGLGYDAASSYTPLTPYLIGTTMMTGRVFGGWLATELYKIWANRVGQPLTDDDINNIVIGDDGNLIIASDIRVTLTWDGGPYTDVDLHFIDPNGERCYYSNSVTALGAELDVDDTDGYGPENIIMEPGEAIPGTYYVEVNYYSDEGWTGQPIYATVTITVHEGSANEVRQTFGPHAIAVCDYNGSDPNAWWDVASINFTTGMVNFAPGLRVNDSPRTTKAR
jgi:Carboxypeptidase regulatory-like domain/Uncharacterized protein conserved in bacteria (DUF2135)